MEVSKFKATWVILKSEKNISSKDASVIGIIGKGIRKEYRRAFITKERAISFIESLKGKISGYEIMMCTDAQFSNAGCGQIRFTKKQIAEKIIL